MLRASATEGTGKELGEFFKRIFFISSISWTRDDYDYDKDDDDDDDDHNVGISHKYFKIGLVACGPCFLFIIIFINVRKQLLTFNLRF